MGSSTQYVEGGVFSKPHSDECEGFNAFVLDTRNRQQKFVNLVWDGRQYRAGEDTERGDEGSGLGWTPLNLNNARRNSEFTLSDQMTAYLDDTGTNLSHPEKGRLTLRDVYVYPRVIEVVQRQRDATNELDSARLLDECDRDRTVLITGDHAVGKTSLAKMLYQAALEREWVPVMLLGRGRLPVDDRLFGHVERQFVEQYGAEQRDAYSRLDRARKVIIVDDYDRFDLRPSELLQLVRQLVLFADRVLLLADDLVLELQDLVSPGLGTDIDIQVSHYRLQPLDRVGRDKLIRRWLHLADQGKNAQHAFLDALERAATIVDSVIGRNVVPSYPIVVLSLLQASQYSVPINTHASTNAYFYNLLIMNQLAAERSQPEFGVMMSYLTLLAYAMFHHGGRISEEGLIGFHQWFETTFRISRPFERFRQELVDQRILQRVDDEYHFRYSYFYYHFLANYMNDNLGKHGIRDEVRRLCERLDNETNANILLFLVHLSRDRFVIDTLMKTVRKQFQGIAPFQLEGGIALTGHADFASLTARFDSENARATRESMLAKMDEGEKLARRHEQQQANDLGTLDEVTNVLRAIRALGILGQVVKNYAGVVPGSIMKEMAVECYELGLRTLTVMVDLVRVREDLIIEAMVHKLRAESGAFTLAEAANMATQNLAALVHMVGSGLIKRTSLAVGSDELGQVYREIVAEHPTLSYQAIDLSIRLDVDDRLPHRHVKQMMDDIERNEFAKSIVRYLVMRRLSLRPGRRDAMQKLCDSVGIEYRRVQRSLARPRDRPWKDGA